MFSLVYVAAGILIGYVIGYIHSFLNQRDFIEEQFKRFGIPIKQELSFREYIEFVGEEFEGWKQGYLRLASRHDCDMEDNDHQKENDK